MLALLLIKLLACGDVCSPQADFWYEQVVAAGGHGRLQHEAGAFLIRERDGSLTLQPWSKGSYRSAQYVGAVPARAIAIVHSHPREEPLPSSRDRAEARRLSMVVVVVTPGRAVAAMPSGGALLEVGQSLGHGH